MKNKIYLAKVYSDCCLGLYRDLRLDSSLDGSRGLCRDLKLGSALFGSLGLCRDLREVLSSLIDCRSPYEPKKKEIHLPSIVFKKKNLSIKN